MTGSDSKSRAPRNDVLNTLGSTFALFQECRPLAIGIHKIILERVPDIDPDFSPSTHHDKGSDT